MEGEILILSTIDEAKQCALLMSSTEPWLTLKRNYDHCLRLFLDRSVDTFILKEGDRVIALCVMDTGNFPKPYIKVLAVAADYRGRGLGTMLISAMEKKYAYVNGKMFIAVSSFNKGARKLYESMGYKQVGAIDDYAVQGHAELLLQKSLPDVVEDVRSPVYVSAELKDMDVDFIYDHLSKLYWATNMTRENLIGRLLNSVCFGVFENGKQKGFARVVTDFFSFAYLADVFVEEASRGKGYSKMMMDYIMDYPVLRDQRFLLVTRDAHGLYEKYGFAPVPEPGRFMSKNAWLTPPAQ